MANPVSRLFLNNNKAPFSLVRTSLFTKSNVNIPKDPRLLHAPTSTILDQTPKMGPVHQVPSFLMGTPLFGGESKWVSDGKSDKFVNYEGGRGLELQLARRKKVYEEEEEYDKETYERIGSSDDDEEWDRPDNVNRGHGVNDGYGDTESDFDDEDDDGWDDELPRKK